MNAVCFPGARVEVGVRVQQPNGCGGNSGRRDAAFSHDAVTNLDRRPFVLVWERTVVVPERTNWVNRPRLCCIGGLAVEQVHGVIAS